MPTRLISKSLVLQGLETTKGGGAAAYNPAIASADSSVELVSDNLEITSKNPNFGGAYQLPTKLSSNVVIGTNPAGVDSNSLELDISNYLQASSFFLSSASQYFLCEHSAITLTGLKYDAPDDTDPTLFYVGGTDTVSILASTSATPPVAGSVVKFGASSPSITLNTVQSTSIYALTNNTATLPTLSLQYWYDDINYVVNAVNGGITWDFDALPSFTFEGQGDYNSPLDGLTPPTIAALDCDLPIRLENLRIVIDNVLITDNACFEAGQFKTNPTQVQAKIPTEYCKYSLLTDIEPVFSVKFSQIENSVFNVYELWEQAKMVSISLSYGTGQAKQNFVITMNKCALTEPPSIEDVQGILYTNLQFTILKPCGGTNSSNVVIAGY